MKPHLTYCMLATGRRDGVIIIVAVVLLLLALITVFGWVRASRREPLPHAAPPARTEMQRSLFSLSLT